MFKPFKETSREWIISENKRLFDIDVCKTCQSQHFEGYARLKNYYLNEQNMAKKDTGNLEETKQDQPVISKKLTLKKEFVGSIYCNGKVSINLDEMTEAEAKEILSTSELTIYFE